MSRRRKTQEAHYLAGFIPKSDFVEDVTANGARKRRIFFFHDLPGILRWHSIVELPVREPICMLDRPVCPECGIMLADLGEFLECLGCGWNSFEGRRKRVQGEEEE